MDAGIEGFFRQLPLGLILMFCGSSLLLIGAVGYIFWSRQRRTRAALLAASSGLVETRSTPQRTNDPMNTQNPFPPSDANDFDGLPGLDDDLPDLEALSHPGTFSAEQPEQPVNVGGQSMPAGQPAIPAPARPAAAYRLSLPNGETTDAIEVLTVLRDVLDGNLIIQVGSQAHKYPFATADADFRRRVAATLAALTRAPGQGAPSSPPAAAAPPKPAAPPPAAAKPNTTPGDLPKFRLEDLPPPTTRRGRLPKVDIPVIDVGKAIEAFLQHQRITQGDFPGRAIHVRSGVNGAIVIEVDGQFYDSVGDVADAEVRAYLQATIADWQSRQ